MTANQKLFVQICLSLIVFLALFGAWILGVAYLNKDIKRSMVAADSEATCHALQAEHITLTETALNERDRLFNRLCHTLPAEAREASQHSVISELKRELMSARMRLRELGYREIPPDNG